jgi:hypothetical protein
VSGYGPFGVNDERHEYLDEDLGVFQCPECAGVAYSHLYDLFCFGSESGPHGQLEMDFVARIGDTDLVATVGLVIL